MGKGRARVTRNHVRIGMRGREVSATGQFLDHWRRRPLLKELSHEEAVPQVNRGVAGATERWMRLAYSTQFRFSQKRRFYGANTGSKGPTRTLASRTMSAIVDWFRRHLRTGNELGRISWLLGAERWSQLRESSSGPRFTKSPARGAGTISNGRSGTNCPGRDCFDNGTKDNSGYETEVQNIVAPALAPWVAPVTELVVFGPRSASPPNSRRAWSPQLPRSWPGPPPSPPAACSCIGLPIVTDRDPDLVCRRQPRYEAPSDWSFQPTPLAA